jgi:type VI secretion system protein ImpC
VRIEMIDISKEALATSFEDAPELILSGLYKQIYTNAYDTPGADPYSAIISNYEFDTSNQDITLLQNVSKVAAAALCPFIGSVGPKFFGVKSMDDWKKIPNKTSHLSTAEYIKWRSFRDSEDSRYVGLTFPRFMLRLPYGPDTVAVKSFNYKEDVTGSKHDRYLWGNASFAFASNMVRAYISDGWCVQIRGPQAGGKVENLPFHTYDEGKGKEIKAPTEVKIDDALELESANLGLIPFSVYENTDFACFFSAQSSQKPVVYDSPAATANSRINARLPYIFLASRIAHYLKVLQRENIGTTKDRVKIENELNTWIKGLVTEMKSPPEDLIAKHPLRAAQVKVEEIEENPGFYRVSMLILPHFQIEGMDISLSLVGKMPKGK